MNKPSIKTITLRRLINVLLGLSLILLLTIAFHFRSISTNAIENQALTHAEVVKAALTAHMKGGIMDKRGYFLSEIQHLEHVSRLHIIRNDPVVAQFGNGSSFEHSRDALITRAFNSKEIVFENNELSLEPTIRVVVPYIASTHGNLNCLGCHKVPEGTVLGGIDITLDVTEYRNHALWVLLGLSLLSLVALILVYLNTSRTLEKHIQNPLETLIANAMRAYNDRSPLVAEQFHTAEFTHVAHEFNLFNSEIVAQQEQLKRKNEELITLNNEIESTLRETVYTMGVIEEKRSKETGNHTKRVSLYSQLLAQKLSLSEKDIDLVTAAAPLHDIGKLGIPDRVLLKPDRLNDEERLVMMNHPIIGHEMLSHSNRDILVAASIIAYQHHEKWNGFGYPRGLSGNDIHIYARIVAIADVFDALVCERVYKSAWPIERIVDFFNKERGQHFDPKLVDLFLSNIDEFVTIYRQNPSEKE